jgi:hypothetical protein
MEYEEEENKFIIIIIIIFNPRVLEYRHAAVST